MKRSGITPEYLRSRGYKEYEFSWWTLEKACEYIQSGCKCKLIPQEDGTMVGVLGPNGSESSAFYRPMTKEELDTYHDWMVAEKKRMDDVSGRIHARHIAMMRRGRR